MKRKLKNSKGFTLVEMMVTVVILSIIVLGLVTFFSGGMRSWVSGQSQLKAQREARQAMDRMVREIREGDKIIDTSTNSAINFHTPFKGNMSFSYNSSEREIKEGTVSLIQNVKNCTITYYDKNKVLIDPSSESDKVSIVKINLEIDVDNDNNTDIHLKSEISLRNFNL